MLTPEEQITQAVKKNKIAGSWLISGPYGVGKKQFAHRLISYLMTQDWNTPIAFHPNVKWIECGLTEEAKKDIQKTILAGKQVEETTKNTARKKEITVDDVREGLKFLSLKSGADTYRILVVNLADDMNINAENALLKVLEEPYPQSLILLLCQNTGKLLPTIRSRCRQIVIPPLSYNELVAEIKKKIPDCKEAELLADLAHGSIGLAMDIYREEGIILYQKVCSFMLPLGQIIIEELLDFVDYVTKDENVYGMTKLFLLNWLADTAHKLALESNPLSETYIDLYQETAKLFADTDNLYLDKKQALIQTFFKIGEVRA